MSPSPLFTRALPALLALTLCACASDPKPGLGQAAEAPLADLNLVQAPIPELLQTVQKAPYALPEDRSCPRLAADIRALDELLGPDLDTPPTEAHPGLVERGTTAVTGAVQRAAEGLIPYRSWVRKLSGAERYSKQVAAAIAAGTVRRGFLKGVARAGGC